MGEKRKNSKKLRYWIGGALLSFCLCLAVSWIVFDGLFLPRGVDSLSVEIPDWCGMALERIVPADWMELETEYRYDSRTPAGVILAQSPDGGSRRRISSARPQCRITLTVSAGAQTVTLPDVVGLDGRTAESRLRELGLTVRVQRIESAYPEGTAFDMTPRAGATLPIGGEVTLSVSAGIPRESVRVPDLVGMTRSEALVQLWLAKLSVGEVVEEAPHDGSEARVVRQSHRAGTLVLAGTPITVYVGPWESESVLSSDPDVNSDLNTNVNSYVNSDVNSGEIFDADSNANSNANFDTNP